MYQINNESLAESPEDHNSIEQETVKDNLLFSMQM